MLYCGRGRDQIHGMDDDRGATTLHAVLSDHTFVGSGKGRTPVWPEIVRWGWQVLATAAIAYALLHKTDRR